MPAGFEGYEPIVLSDFGGWDTFNHPLKVAPPFSPAPLNVDYSKGGVSTRMGLTRRLSFDQSVRILSIKDYTLLDTTQKRLLILSSEGRLSKTDSTYGLTVVASDLFDAAAAAELKMNSATAFGREYIGIARESAAIPAVGYHVPLAYDDTNLDPVAPGGPAYAPTVVDAGAGTVGPESIAAGTHYFRVCFRTRNGFITPPGPATAFIAAGGHKVTVSGLQPGPPYVTARIVCVTPVNNPADFFFIPGAGFEINDNVTTQTTFEFLDTALIAGEQISVRSDPTGDLMNCTQLDEQAGCVVYHNRVGWFGGRRTYHPIGDQWPKNLAFDGGFTTEHPSGWINLMGTMTKWSGPPLSGGVGEMLTVIGDGTNARVITSAGPVIPGETTPTKLSLFPPGKAIRVRVRCRRSGGAGVAGVQFLVYRAALSAIPGYLPTNYAAINATDMSSGEWRWLDAEFLSASDVIGDDAVRVGVTGGGLTGTPLPLNEAIVVDRIEFYSDDAKYEPSTIRWSRAQQPDAYDELYGIQLVGAEDGQRIVAAFSIGDNCYIVKERSIYVTRDDGSNEPAFWGVSNASPTKGAVGHEAIALGERWAVLAFRSGLYYFDGAGPKLISEEIRGTWKRINWAAAERIFTTVDSERRRITVGVPLDSDTEARTLLTLQYFGGESPLDTSRKWGPWTLQSGFFTCGGIFHKNDGTRDVLYAIKDEATPGYVLAAIDDDATHDTLNSDQVILSSYRLPFLPTTEEDGRHQWGAVTANIWGSGQLNFSGYLPDNQTIVGSGQRGVQPILLKPTPIGDYEWPFIDVTTERIAWEISVDTLDSWFTLNRFVQYVKSKPWSRLRGMRGPT